VSLLSYKLGATRLAPTTRLRPPPLIPANRARPPSLTRLAPRPSQPFPPNLAPPALSNPWMPSPSAHFGLTRYPIPSNRTCTPCPYRFLRPNQRPCSPPWQSLRVIWWASNTAVRSGWCREGACAGRGSWSGGWRLIRKRGKDPLEQSPTYPGRSWDREGRG